MENLDALRIVCMAVIIFSHVTSVYLDVASDRGETGGLFKSVLSLNVAARFGVPCFMMISFFIYWHQLYEKGRSWTELLKRRFKRLVPAFVCWSLFYVAFHKLVQMATGSSMSPGLGENLNLLNPRVFAKVFLLGRAEYHLYYLPVVMQCLLLIPLLRLLWRRPVVSWAWIGLTAVWWTVVLYGRSYIDPFHAASWQRAILLISHVTRDDAAPSLLVFPLLGMMFAGQLRWREIVLNHSDRFWCGVLVAGIALHVIETLAVLPGSYFMAAGGLKIGRIITAIGVFALIYRHPFMKDPLPYLSRYAFGMHFMHPAVLLMLCLAETSIFGATIGDWRAYVVPMLAINLALTMGITYALCLLISRSNRLEFLVV